MEIKLGEPLVIKGKRHEVNDMMHRLSVVLQEKGKVLFIDTINSLNPHHPAYQSPVQREIFRNIHCVRTEKPHDLLARIKQTESFIQKNRIKSMLVNSLTNFWEDAEEDEIIPMLHNLLNEIKHLTAHNQLMTVIGNCHSDDKNEIKAIEELSKVGEKWAIQYMRCAGSSTTRSSS